MPQIHERCLVCTTILSILFIRVQCTSLAHLLLRRQFISRIKNSRYGQLSRFNILAIIIFFSSKMYSFGALKKTRKVTYMVYSMCTVISDSYYVLFNNNKSLNKYVKPIPRRNSIKKHLKL